MIDPTTPQFARFMATFAAKLREAREANPQQYAWPLTELPTITARFAQRLAEDPRNVNKNGAGLRATCKALGIKCTYKAITAYLLGEVQS